MWSLLTVATLICALGTTHGLLQKIAPDNPEVNMNISQMISFWGYPSEEYEVVTEDGYVLGIYRIPYGKKNSENIGQRPVVFLQHGLLASATNWIANLPNNSLAFILADAGYDVWLGNSRGNTWSRKNLYYSPNSVEFWAFSFDEMAKYDLPATIDFIVKKTGQEKVHYVGHSQGTTIGFIAFSTNPTLAKKIKSFYALAPIATVKYTTGPIKDLAYIPTFLYKKSVQFSMQRYTLSVDICPVHLTTSLWEFIERKYRKFLKQHVELIFGDKIFLPHNFFDRYLGTEICHRQLLDDICSNAIFILCGYDTKNFNTSRLDVYLGHNPAGTSVQDMLHWAQMIRSGKFQAFNWGSPTLNMQHYNQSTAPYYNVTAMTVPTAVWSGGHDILADPEDVAMLLPKVTNLIYHKEVPSYNHLDFIWATNAPQEVYNEIVSMLAEDK